ncbi:unnamed protein product [Staurois parvus]|uniref:Uncharacterized protein n=1 Tax=Staurois parvus TaxID=386267 RepID=A0ABN9H2B0_9NEOB|nr:unnamed protein product [Staurois parvus]
MPSGKYPFPGNRQTQTRSSDCQTEKYDSSLHRTHIHCSRVQWCDQVAAVPSCFHFVIIPLTADRGIFSRKEISRMDILHK